jgi:RHH-type proline utilization regulon transcriptional repressor/proline dehydrogenase/delta 1-pyrroline-5-carboxylate dehydrogenase
VIAKPAEQTPLIAHEAICLLHEAGVPKDVLLCLPGAGDVGAALTSHPKIGGVAFTGSTETAHARSTARWPPRTGRSCRSSPKPAGSTR